MIQRGFRLCSPITEDAFYSEWLRLKMRIRLIRRGDNRHLVVIRLKKLFGRSAGFKSK